MLTRSMAAKLTAASTSECLFADFLSNIEPKRVNEALKHPRSSVKTRMVPPNNLGPNLAGKPVNETLYKGMIGSLMYLPVSRPDIQFLTCLCARYQSNPKESHLIAVKRIFRYLKGCNMDRKITLDACQFLGGKLVYWSAKKHQSMATSSAKAEYVYERFVGGDSPRYFEHGSAPDHRLRYNNGQYADLPQTKPVKAELLKLGHAENLVNKTPMLKTWFPIVWRLLMTFVIQVLSGNKSSTNQLSSTQQLMVFSLLTRIKIYIEIIYNNLVTRLFETPRKKYVAYPSVVNYQALESPTPLLEKVGKKKKSQTDIRPSSPFSEAQPIDPKDSEGNKNPADKGLPTTSLKDGTRKSKLLPKGKTTDPRRS
ncbi:hypothetical protein Tco_0058473 [Tanacetum coccineum]